MENIQELKGISTAGQASIIADDIIKTGKAIKAGSAEEYQTLHQLIKNKLMTALSNGFFTPETAGEQAGISFSLSRLGAPGVYAEVSAKELDYLTENLPEADKLKLLSDAGFELYD